MGDLDKLDEFLPYLRRLALRHRKFGLRAAHYQAFGASLLATVAQYSGDQWTERTNAAWDAGYGLVATVMLDAVAEADALGPAYWDAEVVTHEPLADGIVRVVARPIVHARFADSEHKGAYRYVAGQYAAVETAALPRVWRDFSFATRPSGDMGGDEVEFHVQLGRSRGVSEVLVNQTAVGDRLRIAAAEGELAFPGPERTSRLLAVVHGTGAAPVHALIQHAIAEGDLRPLTVVLASDEGPHYLADALRALAEEHGEMVVEEVVGDPLAAVHAHAAASDAHGACGAVLVGPSALVDESRSALLAAGSIPRRFPRTSSNVPQALACRCRSDSCTESTCLLIRTLRPVDHPFGGCAPPVGCPKCTAWCYVLPIGPGGVGIAEAHGARVDRHGPDLGRSCAMRPDRTALCSLALVLVFLPVAGPACCRWRW